MTLLVLYILTFIVLSGVMAAVDYAVPSVTHPEIEEMVQQGRWGAEALRDVKRRITRTVVVIVITTNTINVLGPIVVSQKAFALYGPGSLAAVTAVLTFGTIVFSEIIPKALGNHYAPLIGRLSAVPLRFVGYALFPLVVALDSLLKRLTRGKRRLGTEQQIRSLVAMGSQAGYIERQEDQIIRRAFILNDRTAEEIMTPVEKVVAISADNSVLEAAQKVRDHEFSRCPVFQSSIHNVAGLVHSRDILEALVDGHRDGPITGIMRPPLFVAPDRTGNELLMLFRDRHVHLAVVREEDKTCGVVTLEDVLEELVGEIDDEKDVEARAPRPPEAAD